MSRQSIHATAVAIDGRALLIRGPSRAGKSRLAVALIARTTAARPIVLIGDDRILLSETAGNLVARPHPRIAGFVERRGLGIVAIDWLAEAPVGGVVELLYDRATPSPARGEGGLRHVPRLVITLIEANPDRVLAWWDARGAAATSHSPQKRRREDWTCAKD